MIANKGFIKALYSTVLLVLMGLLFLGITGSIYADTPKEEETSSSVSISWEEFKKLLKIDTDEIKLSWDEFKKLLAMTGSDVKVEYNIQDGFVTLNREQFKKLLEKMKGPEIVGLKPPVNYLITKAEYSGVMHQKSTSFHVRFYLEIFKQKRDSYPKIKLLPKDVALREIKLDNVPALIMVEDGWYVLTTDKPGQHVIDLDFCVKSSFAKNPHALTLTIPKTAITLFKLDIPLKDIRVKIPQERHMTVSHEPGHTKVDALLATTSTINVNLHQVVAKKKKKGPAKIYAAAMNLLSIEDDALRVTTRFKLDILQYAIPSVEIVVPRGYSILYVNNQSGQEITGWTTRTEAEKEILTVPFKGAVEGKIIFTVVAEKVFPEKDKKIEFTGFDVIDAVRQTGYVGAEKKSDAEAQIEKADNIDKVDILDLPRELVNMSTQPMLFGLRYTRNPFTLTVKIIKHEALPVVHTVIDNANVISVFLDDGKVITRIVYTMQNTEKQFLELTLPKGAEIWSLYVDGSREVPAKNDKGKFMIPLARSKVQSNSIVPFNIEILYYTKNTKFAVLGSERLHFPQVDVVISKMLWSCYLPLEYQYVHFGGNMEKEAIATGINPLIGRGRVFTYDDVKTYNKALENWEKPVAGAVDKEIEAAQRKLKSEFRSAAANEQGAFLSQLREEINFAANVQKEQQQGGAFLKIDIPTSGQLYRFAKTIVKGEDLYVDVQYMSGWMMALSKIVFFILICFVIYLLRFVLWNLIKGFESLIAAQSGVFDWLRSRKGTRVALILGAIIFIFISKLLFVVFVLLFLLAWFKPEWIFSQREEASGS